MAAEVFYGQDFLEKLYIEKKYDEVIEYLLLEPTLTLEMKKKLAYAYFHNRQYENAYVLFEELNQDYQKGQCQIMLDNLDKAYQIFDNAQPSSPVIWGKCLVELIQMKLSKPPSYLQIRNFFESDLSLLIEGGKIEYAENLIKWNELLSDFNLETHKFIGKALFFNGYYKLALSYFDRSKEILPNDPESYYYLAQYYRHFDEDEIAKRYLKQAVKLNPEYTPAQRLLLKLESINK